MGAQQYTPNLHLPIFGPSDKPSWQGDVTQANQSIDAGYATLLAKINDLQNQINTITGAH